MDKHKQSTILILDDSEDTLEMIRRNLEGEGYRIFTTTMLHDAVNLLEKEHFDLVITDLKMPGGNGMDMIRHIRENYRDLEVIMITGFATVDGAVEAMQTGATDFISKPFTREELLESVTKALSRIKLRNGDSMMEPVEAPEGFIGNSDAMQSIYRAINKASKTLATVLITGESGTGKELVARAIHYSSPRASATFVPVNCGGIPQELLESELFGHVKGSFTGASDTRAGFFQTADGGSIFLDEISETSLSMQVKLLRVLQEKEVTMVGSRKPTKVNVRVIAATNKDLLSLVNKGIFREDLYYRLNVIEINVPPLRDRGDDIIMLKDYFVHLYAEEMGTAVPSFTDRALQAIKDYDWPGNVRELENLVQRLVVMTEDKVIDVPDLPSPMRYSAHTARDLTRPLIEVEKEYIRQVLDSVDGNKTHAAKILDIDRKTLRNKVEEDNQ